MCTIIGCIGTKKSQSDNANSKIGASKEQDVRQDLVKKSDEEWRTELSEQEYYVLRDKGTERAFTGSLLNIKDSGTYKCKGCGLDLFHSKSKFESGTGWPSYYEPITDDVIKEDTDYYLGYARTEVMCARCSGHLGHVFPDGPPPTGLRYCINSVSMTFQKSGE